MNKQGIVYLLLVVAIALQVSAISTDHWSCKKSGANSMHVGLWKACMDIGKGSACAHIPPEDLDMAKIFPKNSLYAVRAFAILGVLLVAFSLLCSSYLKGHKKCQAMCLVGGAICSIIANVIWAAELLKYGPKNAEVKTDPGYSFYLNLSGGLVALLAAGYQYSV